MFKTIVIGTDGMQGGADAVALGQALAGLHTELVLVNAYPYERQPTKASVQGFEEQLRADALEMLGGAAADLGAADVVAVADTSPGRALHRVAEDRHADLIVVGSSHHDHALARVVLGDVSRATLHGAPCAVAVAPRGYAEHRRALDTIGVGYQRSDEGDLALALACDIASDNGAAVRARTVVHLPTAAAVGYTYAYDWTAIRQGTERQARADLEEATAHVGLPVVTEITSGIASFDLEDLSGEVNLLVVGSRRWGTLDRVLLGSTADRLAHKAHCPLIVVPRPARDRAKRAPAAMTA